MRDRISPVSSIQTNKHVYVGKKEWPLWDKEREREEREGGGERREERGGVTLVSPAAVLQFPMEIPISISGNGEKGEKGKKRDGRERRVILAGCLLMEGESRGLILAYRVYKMSPPIPISL